MLAEMTSAQVAEWYAYYKAEPWGTQEEDRRAATIAATVANTAPRKKGSKPYRVEQFMPRREPTVQSWRQQKAAFAALTGAG